MQGNLFNNLTHILSSSQKAQTKPMLSLSVTKQACYFSGCQVWLPPLHTTSVSTQFMLPLPITNPTLQNHFAITWRAERPYLSTTTSHIPNFPKSRLFYLWRETVGSCKKMLVLAKKYASFKTYPSSPSKYIAFSSMRSIIPLKFPSSPIGIWTKAALCFNLDLKKWTNIN